MSPAAKEPFEATNPATGQLYKPTDFSVINWNQAGTAMLQDAIWASTERLQDPTYQDLTTRFVAASIEFTSASWVSMPIPNLLSRAL